MRVSRGPDAPPRRSLTASYPVGEDELASVIAGGLRGGKHFHDAEMLRKPHPSTIYP
jgi:hypothetical protein